MLAMYSTHVIFTHKIIAILQDGNARIFLLSMYEAHARPLICEVT